MLLGSPVLMRITTFRSAYDDVGEQIDVDWGTLKKLAEVRRVTRDPVGHDADSYKKDCDEIKKLCPAICGGIWPVPRPPGRKGDDVIEVSIACLDFDNRTLEEVQALMLRLQESGLGYILYTTWSHALPGPIKFRIILQLSRPVPGDMWRDFYRHLIDIFGCEADSQCVDPGRLMFFPATPECRKDMHFAETRDGNPLDVSVIQARPAPPKPSYDMTVGREVVEAVARQLSRKTEATDIQAGQLLMAVCKGLPFAEPGTRDNTVFFLACKLAERFPDANATGLAAIFAESLAVMMPVGSVTVEIIAEKISRKQREYRALKQGTTDDRIVRIMKKYGNGRDWGYTADELSAYGDMRKQWILYKGDEFWTFFDGTYVGHRGKYDELALLDDLAPATGIPLVRPTKQGWEPIGFKELAIMHGTSVGQVQGSYLEPRTRYDAPSRTLVESVAPLRRLEPLEDPRVGAWLQLLGGEPLLDWLAVCPDLRRAAPALVLVGAANVGKSLLAQGLAYLWSTEGPTDMTDAMGSFDENLLKCPLVFGDEKIPKDHKGRAKTEELRTMITRQRQTIRRKHRPNYEVAGALRVMVAANNTEALWGNSRFTQDDIKALAQRVVYIEPNPEAEAYLADHHPGENLWAERDMISRHVLWLQANRAVSGAGRLACPPHFNGMLDNLTIGGAMNYTVFHWIREWLKAPDKLLAHVGQTRGISPVMLSRGRICVRASEMVKFWGVYSPPGQDIPTPARIHDVLRIVAPVKMRSDPSGPRYCILDKSLFEKWCLENDEDMPDLEAAERMRAN